MKKRIGIISAILVVALVFALTFALLASAETVNEATLTVTNASGTTTKSGSYDEMAEALNSAMSSLGEGTATLKLSSNAVATKKLSLTGSGTETVVIDLAGYTLVGNKHRGDKVISAVASDLGEGNLRACKHHRLVKPRQNKGQC